MRARDTILLKKFLFVTSVLRPAMYSVQHSNSGRNRLPTHPNTVLVKIQYSERRRKLSLGALVPNNNGNNSAVLHLRFTAPSILLPQNFSLS